MLMWCREVCRKPGRRERWVHRTFTELWHVEDLQFHQSLLDRILCIGEITVVSHDETTPRLRLQALPHPRPIFETLKQRIITVKRQRGVIKLDAG